MTRSDLRNSLLLYVGILAVFGIGIGFALLHPPTANGAPSHPLQASGLESYAGFLVQQLRTPVPRLLLQIIVIVAFSKAFAILLRFLGQPAVVVEILAGVVLGPSVLGLLWPQAMTFLFPPESFPSLTMLSQLGLILYMFVVGMHLDTRMALKRADSAVLLSHSSIICPFFLGVCCAWVLYRPFAPPTVGFIPFALFMGIAMSITAFPVLARILSERQLTTTPIGALALTSAALGDLTAWCLLALVVCIARTGPLGVAVGTLAATAIYAVVMLAVVRPLVRRLMHAEWLESRPDKAWMAVVLLYLLISSLISDLIGIHALFGAFIAGVCMPQMPPLRARVTDRVEYIAEIVLLPLFFALTGLRTQIGLLNTSHLWLACALVVSLAVIGKLVGGTLVARCSGIAWRDSLLLGVLLNTRGLMELVVLNIGFDLGILSRSIFTILVLMALVTTFMTGPLVGALTHRRSLRVEA